MSRLLWTATAGAAALAGGTLADATLTAPGFEVDALRALVLLLVTATGATAVAFSRRALRGEAYQQRFERLSAGLVVAGAAFATTTDLLVLAGAWVAVGAAAVALIGTGPDAGRRQRTARARVAMGISDVAFVAAIAVLVAASGGTSIAGIAAIDGAWATVAGLGIVAAAVARAATMPLHRWLADSLAAPTPSSALLHAGVVNGGAVAAIVLAPVTSDAVVPALAAVAIGTASCIVAEATMLTRPDVKGRLAWSTTAQMSFTLVLVGLGLHTAAVLHLVAHGLFKATLFLGSGGVVRRAARAAQVAPPVGTAPRRHAALAGVAAAAVAVATLALVAPGAGADLWVPTLLATVAAATAGRAALDALPTPGLRAGALAATSGLLAAFVVVAATLKDRLEPALGPDAAALAPALVVPLLLALATVAVSHGRPHRPGSAAARAWALAQRCGRPAGPLPTVAPATPPHRPAADPVPALLTRG